MTDDTDNFEEYGWSIDPDIVRLADALAVANAEIARLRAEREQAREEIAKQETALDAAAKDTQDAARRLYEYSEHVNFYANLMAQTEMKRRSLDEQVEFYRGELAKAQACANELAELSWKWKYKADCQRRTIRSLVVAARAMWWAHNWRGASRAILTMTMKAIKQAERGQE